MNVENGKGGETKTSKGGKYGHNNRVMLWYGREGIESNEEWVYTINLEKIYGGILNSNSVTLLREYMEALIRIVDPMGHTIRLIPYVNGDFATGIYDASGMASLLEEEKNYIYHTERKPKFNHVKMKIRIVTSLKLELLRDPGDMRMARERESVAQ